MTVGVDTGAPGVGTGASQVSEARSIGSRQRAGACLPAT